MDRGYVDFEQLFTLHMSGAFFVIRAKSNTRYQRRYSSPVDKSSCFSNGSNSTCASKLFSALPRMR
jgi:hypothetical protein